ncbi:hypothetical protein PG984_012438 [Apiospora sp. TS-2023a]
MNGFHFNPNAYPFYPPGQFQFNARAGTFHPQSFLPNNPPYPTYQPTLSHGVASSWVVQPSSGWGGYSVTGLSPAGRYFPPASWPAAYPNPSTHPGPYR